MSLSGEEKVTVAEITYETYAKVDELAATLTADQEASIISDIETWATIRDSHVKLKGGSDGLDFDNERKREAIRRRVRRALGLPLSASALCPRPVPFAGGISRADMSMRNENPDTPRSAFSTGLHMR